jgi:Fe(3+) dicitrate transport protein
MAYLSLRKSKIPFAISTLVASSMCSSLSAQTQEIELPRIDIVEQRGGSISKIPGTVDVITKKELEILQPLSLQDALKTVPGVFVRGDEGGNGAIPNIGLRGLNPNRSQKVLLLEDGAPIQPSLFIANQSYYSPPVGRMSGIEVLKGASGLKYGPSNIGGVINYLTKTPQEGFKVTGKLGNYGYRYAEIEAGATSDSGKAIGGLNIITNEGDGFQSNGFKMYDVLLKAGTELSSDQWLGFKYTHYENNINSSYVGLSADQYINKFSGNLAPNDYFIPKRDAIDINHAWQISNDTKISTLLYWSNLERNYWRQPNKKTTTERTFTECNGVSICLNGNNREFEMLGLDTRMATNFQVFDIQNEAEFGVRLHTESQRNQRVVSKTGSQSGDVNLHEENKANSIALYAQNRFSITDNFAVIPGIRIESYNQTRKNVLTTTSGSAKNLEAVPQIGATWQLVPEAQLYASVYKGFAPAQLATAIDVNGVDQQLDPERSTNMEMGVRGKNGAFTFDSAIFSMNFSNQIVNQATSAGISKANSGQSLHQGGELSLAYLIGSGWSVNGNATYIPVAKFVGTNSLGQDGKRIPYSPKLTSNLGLNFQKGSFNTLVSMYYVSSQFADAANTVEQNKLATLGKLPAINTFNWSANYSINKMTKVFGVINNIFNKRYITSRSPDGIFASAPLNFQLGLSYQFY